MPDHTARSSAQHEILYRHVREWKYCDVLIDCMAGFPFQDEIDALDDQSVYQCRLADPIFAESPAQAPLLVRLPWTQAGLLEKYLDYSIQEAADPDVQTRTVCAFLFSPLEQPKLGKLLTRRLDVPVQTVGNIYFRYFDPRVTRHWARILDINQLTTLMHGIQTWLYVDWTGQLDIITAESQEAVPRFTMTAAQWQQMQGIEAFNLALRLLLQIGFLDCKPDAESEIRLLAAVRDAAITGLTMPEDQATFAAYALKFGVAFTHHPRLAEAIGSAKQHGSPFADALETYTGITLASISPTPLSDRRATT